MIDSQRGAKRRVGYNHLISKKRAWNNCFIKNHQQILLDFADFAWLEQPERNLIDAISRVWYNGSYTIAAKPIKTLELHYTMIQFLINTNTLSWQKACAAVVSFPRTHEDNLVHRLCVFCHADKNPNQKLDSANPVSSLHVIVLMCSSSIKVSESP